MLCSVIIPSRHRWEKLYRLIKNIDACCNRQNVEIIVRADTDDPEVDIKIPGVNSWIIGPRYRGYKDVQRFYTEASNVASGYWVWLLNDDAVIYGNDFDSKLEAVTDMNAIVEPEFQQYRGEPHVYGDHSPFPIVPNGCWNEYGFDQIPIDCKLYEVLLGNHWPIKILSGITFNHDRGSDEEVIAQHLL